MVFNACSHLAQALKCNAEAIYLGGGITTKILPALYQHFHSTFIQKGRYDKWLSGVSVWIIAATEPGLMGVQVIADRLTH